MFAAFGPVEYRSKLSGPGRPFDYAQGAPFDKTQRAEVRFIEVFGVKMSGGKKFRTERKALVGLIFGLKLCDGQTNKPKTFQSFSD